MRTKKLGLRKEALGDLTSDQLVSIAGGAETLHTCRPPMPCFVRTIVDCVPTLGPTGCAHTRDICVPTLGDSECVC